MRLIRLELDDPSTGQTSEFVIAAYNQTCAIQPVNAIQSSCLT